MVQIIENRKDAQSAECIEFRPYRSPNNPARILAHWMYAVEEPDFKAVSIGHNVLGTPVEEEYRRVLVFAQQVGVPFVRVNDPDDLFPPPQRPTGA